MQQPARLVLDDPVAQRVPADVGGVLGIVVDAAGRAVAEQTSAAGSLRISFFACFCVYDGPTRPLPERR